MDVKTVMDTWTLQMGFPVITVTRDYSAQTATVAQSRFLVTTGKAPGASAEGKEFRWWVPLTWSEAGGDFTATSPKEWLGEAEASKKVAGLPGPDTAVVFNVQETGYYRVNYDGRNWELLARQLDSDHTAIHVVNRWTGPSMSTS
jgi:aminopeptidase N